MPAPQAPPLEDVSSRLKREDPVPRGEDGVFTPVVRQIAWSGEAICQALCEGCSCLLSGAHAHGARPDIGALSSCSVPDLGVQLLHGI